MATNASSLVNFGATTQSVGDWMYSQYAMPSPGYLPLNSYTASYLVSSYPALGALIVPVITPVSYLATARTLPSTRNWTIWTTMMATTFLHTTRGTWLLRRK